MAIGTSALAGGHLQVVVFLAVILHKLPGAFGFTSFLVRQPAWAPDVRKWLAIYCVAPLVGGILTLMTVAMFGGASGDLSYGLGCALLFSGGTFLFTISTHIVPEIQRGDGSQVQWPSMVCLVAGMLSPLLIGEHSH